MYLSTTGIHIGCVRLREGDGRECVCVYSDTKHKTGMLVTTSSNRFRIATIVTAAAVLLYAFTTTCTTCGGYTTHRRHAHACIRSDAYVQVAYGNATIDHVVPGDLVLTEDHTYVEVSRVLCHNGNFVLWKMPGVPPLTTSNHPMKIKGKWFAGDPEGASRDFHLSVESLGVPSTTMVDVVCSVETIANTTVSIVVFWENHKVLVAD